MVKRTWVNRKGRSPNGRSGLKKSRSLQVIWSRKDLELLTFLADDLELPCWAIGRLLYRSASSIRTKLRAMTGKYYTRGEEPSRTLQEIEAFDIETAIAHANGIVPFRLPTAEGAK